MNIVLCGVAAAVLAALFICGYCSNFQLKTEHYLVGRPDGGGEKGKPIRIVMLADLHGAVFGIGNRRLIDRIREEQPDLICIAGDMTVKDGRGMDSCLALCRELLSVCPVYYAMGNHEIRMEGYADYCLNVKKTGVCVLDNECRRIVLNGIKIGIYGWNADEFYYHKFWQKRELTGEELRALVGVPEPDEYRILLAHNPEYFDAYCEWGADLILSGHVHGGIARLPFAGGVIDPALRLFPKYDAGLYKKGTAAMVLSRGLGTHHIRLRFFNSPEISVVNVLANETSFMYNCYK